MSRHSHEMVGRINAGKPVFAWDDPNARYENEHGVNTADNDDMTVDHHHKNTPLFYDREALEEKMRELRAEETRLLAVEAGLKDRLSRAEETLSAARAEKRALFTATVVATAAQDAVSAGGSAKMARSYCFKASRGRGCVGDSDDHDGDKRAHRLEELAKLTAKDRIMELELLNDQLRKGQSRAEVETRSHEAASLATKAELARAEHRLNAMPKRFTESLQMLRDEVEALEKERVTLQLATQKKSLEETDLLDDIRRRQKILMADLDDLLDEIDDVEDDRDRWKRQLKVESSRVESLQSQRAQAVTALRSSFGEDAVERAAFITAVFGRREGDQGLSGEEGGQGASSSFVPASIVAEALRPAYAPDGINFSSDAVIEAARECLAVTGDGVDFELEMEGFCSLAKHLLRRQSGVNRE